MDSPRCVGFSRSSANRKPATARVTVFAFSAFPVYIGLWLAERLENQQKYVQNQQQV